MGASGSDIRKCFAHGERFLMEGAVGTRLLGEYGLKAESFIALAAHIYSEAGRTAVGEIYMQYMHVAQEHSLPFVANTPTRRTNRERAPSSKQGESAIGDNDAFLRSLDPAGTRPVFAGGGNAAN